MLLKNFANRDTAHARESIVIAPINNTQGVKTMESRRPFSVFDVSERGMGDVVIEVLPSLGDAVTQSFHVAQG
ncbi:MAG: hypothetical protein WA474_18850 [Candidatus Sulfotelmatobacter sp.]